MIVDKLWPIIRSGHRIEDLELYVCKHSPIAEQKLVQTSFGDLVIRPSEYVPKGYSYIMEKPNGGDRAFAWVSGYKYQERGNAE